MKINKIFKSIMFDIICQTIPNEFKHYHLRYLNIELDSSQLQKKEFINLVKSRLKYNYNKKTQKKLNKQFNKLTKKSCISLHDFMY